MDPLALHPDAVVRVFAGGLGALAGLIALTVGFLVALARSSWPGR